MDTTRIVEARVGTNTTQKPQTLTIFSEEAFQGRLVWLSGIVGFTEGRRTRPRGQDRAGTEHTETDHQDHDTRGQPTPNPQRASANPKPPEPHQPPTRDRRQTPTPPSLAART
jgi:hypothetical protein